MACSAGAELSDTSSRRAVSSSADTISRVSRNSPGLSCFGSTWNGPVPVPLRTIANSGWASTLSKLGRGAFSRISITRSVIATMSSTAPAVSFSGLTLDSEIDRFRILATCCAVIFLPPDQSADAIRKM